MARFRRDLAARAVGRATRAMRRLAEDAEPAAPVPRPERWDSTQTSAFYAWCMANGADTRPQYLWPLLHTAHVAHELGIPEITAIEFGVAGGNGLLAMERAAAQASELSGTRIRIFGFDIGTGMPTTTDPRDAPWLIPPALFAMDVDALRARLTTAELVLGPVAETVAGWMAADHPPIGFIAFDLDYYSSTVDALGVLRGDAERLLPRVPCYVDDTFGYSWTDFMGVHAAIDEFNAAEERKIGKIHGLRYELPPEEFRNQWHEKLYVAHVFDHPRYNEPEGRAALEQWGAGHSLRPS